LEIFKQYDQVKKNVSVEVELFDSTVEDGLRKMNDWSYSAICVLGDFVTPASPNASITMLSFAEQEKKDYDKAYFLEFGKYDSLNFRIPKSVKDNSQEGLNLYKEFNKDGTSIGLSTARYLTSEVSITPKKVKHIHKYIKKYSKNDFSDKSSDEWIMFQLFGGISGLKWIEKLLSHIAEIDERNIKYFDSINFPYNNLKDVNPALKGIEPPITLSQANKISKIADAIGSDDKKNGWAIAISQFKKTHVVKDGKWVEKDMENNSKEEELSMGEIVEEKDKPKEPILEMEEKPNQEEEQKQKEKGEKEPEKEPEEKEPEKEFSLDANLDIAAMLAMLEDETEDYKTVAGEEFSKPESERNFAKVCNAMYGKMCKMKSFMEKKDEESRKAKEDNESYMAELKELREFKSSIEKKDFELAVLSFIEEVRSDIPKEKLEELVAESGKYTFDTIDGWKNIVKATAYTFAKSKDENEGIIKIGLPFDKKETKKTSLWGI
jgi:hypothetical protein